MTRPEVRRPSGAAVRGLRLMCIVLVVVLLHVLLADLLISSAPRPASPRHGKTVDTVVIQPVIAPQQPGKARRQAPAPGARKSPPPDVPSLAAVPSPAAMPSPEVFPSPEALPRMSHQAPVLQAASGAPATVAAPAALLPPASTVTAPLPASIRLVCPTQVAPEMPRRALNEGIEGVVRARIHIKGSRILEVTILSGPSVFHAAVREAMLQYNCMTDGGEVFAIQDFNFKRE